MRGLHKGPLKAAFRKSIKVEYRLPNSKKSIKIDNRCWRALRPALPISNLFGNPGGRATLAKTGEETPMIRKKLLSASGLGGALAVLLSQPVFAQAAEEADSENKLDAVIVTATRRAMDVTDVPYNISAIGSDKIERLGIKSFENLAAQIPNLNLNSVGDRSIGAQRPVIRGLNASASNRSGQAQEQAPVATYIGNVPSPAGLFPVNDIERVEVLRGPQGTLYGAGALGGAVRIIPATPKLGEYEGSVTASVGTLSHSDDLDYGLSGVINIPLGENFALRASAARREDAGFIDKFGVFVREGNEFSLPVLATPGNIANSAAVTRADIDSNWSRSDSLRVALTWAPADGIELTGAYNRSELSGEGGPADNPGYPGGADPLDSRITYPALDEYEVVLRGVEPYRRDSEMMSLDASFDVGFATLSSTTSYTDSQGDNVVDNTYGILALPDVFRPYYTGNPANPRFMSVSNFADSTEILTQEVRLVSQTEGPLEYILGAFYQEEERNDTWLAFIPGTPAQTAASGGLPVFAAPGDQALDFAGDNKFTDTSLFGELTWNINDDWQITGGGRIFQQEFERSIDFQIPLFGIFAVNTNETSVEDSTFKLNSSYSYTDGHNVYATFSQGFRRGGANSFAITGIVAEPASLLDYTPDTVDNFEIGAKGRFAGGLRYSANVFFIKWYDPQIGIFTPINVWPIVINGSEAESQGFELEVNGTIAPNFSFDVGYAYADAQLTEDFCVPVGNGGGGFIACGVQGLDGTTLPGSPKQSATLNFAYLHELTNESDIEFSVNATYKGKTLLTLPSVNLLNPELDGFWTINANAAWSNGPWQASVYARNLFDDRDVLAVNLRQAPFLGPLDDISNVTRPRSVGVQLSYNW
jgi:outer membrane receptor protein involved in Fe transport